jgi:hypothetical protein
MGVFSHEPGIAIPAPMTAACVWIHRVFEFREAAWAEEGLGADFFNFKHDVNWAVINKRKTRANRFLP